MTEANDKLHEVIESILEPLVRGDGGELYVGRAASGEILLHLAGKFSGCPGNSLAIRSVIEPALNAAVPGERVRVSSGELVPEGLLPVAEYLSRQPGEK